jgi:2'-hydroxyisoflavone reductase
MKLLILGGSHFVGRALAEEAMVCGDDVSVLNRGLTGHNVSGTRLLRADRTDADDLARVLSTDSFDAVIDTWSGAPIHATSAAQLLGPRCKHYAYVSSRSVYTWPMQIGLDETHPVVDADPLSPTSDDYAIAKRGSELGVLAARPDALIARVGLILGPYEDIGRLPWWLQRVALGGRVLAPGPEAMPLQYIDARDLAIWMLHCAREQTGGVFNTVSPVGHTTMGELLEASRMVTASTVESTAESTAELMWFTPEAIESAGIKPWTELPIWVPPTGPLAGLHNCDVSAAMAAGLRCRPVLETVRDTWTWLQSEGFPIQRDDRPTHGLSPAREAELLATAPVSS